MFSGGGKKGGTEKKGRQCVSCIQISYYYVITVQISPAEVAAFVLSSFTFYSSIAVYCSFFLRVRTAPCLFSTTKIW